MLTDDHYRTPLFNVYAMTIIVNKEVKDDTDKVGPNPTPVDPPISWEVNEDYPDLEATVVSVSDEGLMLVEFSELIYPLPNLQGMIDKA